MNKTIGTFILMFVIAGLMALVVVGSQEKEKQLAESTVAELQQGMPIFYYGTTCPYCDQVKEWFEENDVVSKVPFESKEVYDNRANSAELNKVAASCGIPSNQIGVPFLYAEGKCLIGKPDIITYFEGLLESAAEQSDEEGDSDVEIID
jgi:glutaredoxin